MTVAVRGLRKREEFLRLKAGGRRASGAGFVLQYIEDKAEMGVAVGYTASSHAVGNAVCRNRARRRLRACFDRLVRLNPQAEGAGKVLVWVAKETILDIDFKKLEDEMAAALAQAGLTLAAAVDE
jgi:ribonuclease P protein component